MATTRFIDIKVTDKRAASDVVGRSLRYDWNFKKTRNGELITTINCEKDSAITEFLICQKEYEMKTGKAVDLDEHSNVIYKIRQSFEPGEVDADTAHEIGVKLANSFLKNGYQCSVSTHIDKKHIHNHITFNAVSLDLKKYDNKKYDWKILRQQSDRLCKEYGLSIVVPNAQRRSQVYSKCKSVSFRQNLQADMDEMLKRAASYDEFISLMSEQYVVDTSHKFLTFRHKTNGQQKNIRSDSLGGAYTSENLRKAFAVQSKPFAKMRLTLSQIVKAKGKRLLENSKAVSYSQQLKTVTALLQAVGVINENKIHRYRELPLKLSDFSTQLLENDEKLQQAQRELSKLNALFKSAELIDQHQPIVSGYQSSLLPEHYYASHKDEIELFHLAQRHLKENNVDTAMFNKTELITKINHFDNTLQTLLEGSKILKEQILKLQKTKEVVDELHATTRQNHIKVKVGHNYDR